MKVNYKGMDKNFEYRIAEINFNENEMKLMERLAFWLERIKGYNIDIVTDSYAIVQVEDMTEYKEFVKDYKEGKKMIKNCMEYGF